MFTYAFPRVKSAGEWSPGRVLLHEPPPRGPGLGSPPEVQEPLELDCVTTALLLPREGPRTHRLPFASNGGFGLGSARGEENSSVLGVGCSVQNDG